MSQLAGTDLLQAIMNRVETMIGDWGPIPEEAYANLSTLRSTFVDDTSLETIAIAIATIDVQDQKYTVGDILDRLQISNIVTPCGCVRPEDVPLVLANGLADVRHGAVQTGPEIAQRLRELIKRAEFIPQN